MTPQAMHDDGSSDSSDEEEYQEESVAQTSMEVEVRTTTQDTTGNCENSFSAYLWKNAMQ